MFQLFSRFYTVIPHDFGRNISPTIRTLEDVQQKFDDLVTLSDIEIAQALQKTLKNKGEDALYLLELQYGILRCKLEHLKPLCGDYKIARYEKTKNEILLSDKK